MALWYKKTLCIDAMGGGGPLPTAHAMRAAQDAMDALQEKAALKYARITRLSLTQFEFDVKTDQAPPRRWLQTLDVAAVGDDYLILTTSISAFKLSEIDAIRAMRDAFIALLFGGYEITLIECKYKDE